MYKLEEKTTIMKNQKMKKELEQQLNLSSIERRIVAFMIDYFVVTALLVSIVFLALGTNFIDEAEYIFDINVTTIIWVVIVPTFIIYSSKDSIKGISVGKWVMGIMVRDTKNPNEVPSFVKLLIRNLYMIIWPVELIALASSKEKKRLGDKTAKTIVVNNPNKPTTLPRILPLIGAVIIFITITFSFTITSIKNSGIYKASIQEIEQNQKILVETGGIKGYRIIPAGEINILNGNGEAELEIKVLGNEKDLNVSVYLPKDPFGEWKLIEVNT